MRNTKHVLLTVAVLAVAVLGGGCGAPANGELEIRPGSEYEGSARWAWDRALPVVQSQFASAFELRQVLGATMPLDGRLSLSTGNWSFVTYHEDASGAQTYQVTVGPSGGTSSTLRTEIPPGPGILIPLPSDWANSTVVMNNVEPFATFAGATRIQLMVLNVADYGGVVANQAAWGINFDLGPNQIARVDGSYVGEQ